LIFLQNRSTKLRAREIHGLKQIVSLRFRRRPLSQVCYRRQPGKYVLNLNFTAFDPELPFTTTLANGRVGWEAAIRSSRLNDANAPEAAIQLRAAESALSIAALRHCAHIASVSTIGGRHFDQAWTILARK